MYTSDGPEYESPVYTDFIRCDPSEIYNVYAEFTRMKTLIQYQLAVG
jgi:hypothetical protein